MKIADNAHFLWGQNILPFNWHRFDGGYDVDFVWMMQTKMIFYI